VGERRQKAGAFLVSADVQLGMPKTEEIKCTSQRCELDMFENHYTYDIDDDLSISDLQCPMCGGTDCLEAVEL
jgi:hypothetical protein